MDNTKLHQIKNWKLCEIIDQVEIVADKSQDFVPLILDKLNIPKADMEYFMWNKTEINWDKIGNYYKFMYYREGIKESVRDSLIGSIFGKHNKVIIPYGWDEPVVKIPLKSFCNSWDEFIASTVWQTIIFTEDYSLFIEATPNNYLYSTFKIIEDDFK